MFAIFPIPAVFTALALPITAVTPTVLHYRVTRRRLMFIAVFT